MYEHVYIFDSDRKSDLAFLHQMRKLEKQMPTPRFDWMTKLRVGVLPPITY
jgi:hypothetical protein